MAEDDSVTRKILSECLVAQGWRVKEARDGMEALGYIDQADVLLTDHIMPRMDGLELLVKAKQQNPRLKVILISGFGTIPFAVEAISCGAISYMTKPPNMDKLLKTIRFIESSNAPAESTIDIDSRRGGLDGNSSQMKKVFSEIDWAVASTSPVLITGETGTGKELAAQAIHQNSQRSRGPFVAINLAAIPEELAESELFGHEKGAFTGSGAKRRGHFFSANGGTLFLDEINSASLGIQAKLLRAIETGKVWPLGAERPTKVDVRIMAAMNASPEKMVAKGLFRKDLFYRLAVMRVQMPPLRKRPEDISEIVKGLLRNIAMTQPNTSMDISPKVLTELRARAWPGNVRELRNVLERAFVRARMDPGNTDKASIRIRSQHLESTARQDSALPFKEAKSKATEEWVRTTVQETLDSCKGNVSAAARKLIMSRTALVRIMIRHGINRLPDDMPLSPQ